MITTKQLRMELRNKIEDRKNELNLSYYDMAKLAEKSLMTVSNSVNKPHLVKLETMEEIWNLLAEL